MGQILFTSDLHSDKGIRVQITISYLEYLEKYCSQNNIKDIVFSGDILNRSSKINNDTFVPLFLKFMEMKSKGLNLIFILGNHDVYNKDNESLIQTFSSFGVVITKSATLTIAGNNYDCLAYTESKEDIPNNSPTLLTHLPIMNFFYDNGFGDSEAGFSPEDFDQYQLCVTGHFHKKQENGNIVYPGAPYQLFGFEQGQKKYFAIVDGSTYELIEYTEAPTFLTIKIEDFKKYDFKNKFVTVEIDKKVEQFVKLKHILYNAGAIDVVPKFLKGEESIDTGEHEVDINANISVSAKAFLQTVKKDGIDNTKLLNYFDKILKVVM